MTVWLIFVFTVHTICVALRDLVPFVLFKKRKKHPWRSVNFSVKLQAEAYNFTNINTPPCVFFTFLKLYKWYQIAQCITYFFVRVAKTSRLFCKGLWDLLLSVHLRAQFLFILVDSLGKLQVDVIVINRISAASICKLFSSEFTLVAILLVNPYTCNQRKYSKLWWVFLLPSQIRGTKLKTI